MSRAPSPLRSAGVKSAEKKIGSCVDTYQVLTGCETSVFLFWKCNIIFLKISNVIDLFGPRWWRKAVPERGSPSHPSQLKGVFMRRNWPLFPSQQCSRMFSLSSLDRVDPASWASWSGEMLARLEGWVHHTGSLEDRLEPRPLLWKGVYQLILSGNFLSCRQQF